MKLTLTEIENLLMMVRFARSYGHYDHSFARAAIKKLEDERKELLGLFYVEHPATVAPMTAREKEDSTTN